MKRSPIEKAAVAWWLSLGPDLQREFRTPNRFWRDELQALAQAIADTLKKEAQAAEVAP